MNKLCSIIDATIDIFGTIFDYFRKVDSAKQALHLCGRIWGRKSRWRWHRVFP